MDGLPWKDGLGLDASLDRPLVLTGIGLAAQQVIANLQQDVRQQQIEDQRAQRAVLERALAEPQAQDEVPPKMTVTPQSLPILQTQVPPAPSSSPAQRKRRRPAKSLGLDFAGLMTTTRKPWCTSNRVPLCLGYPVHRSLPPTRRSSSDESIVPSEA